MRLENWDSRSLAAYVSEFRSHMEDYGTETSIARVRPIKASLLLPHFTNAPAELIEFVGPAEPEFAEDQEGAAEDLDLDLDQSQTCPQEISVEQQDIFEDPP
eukprot:3542721-Karenia_brevis.AAC.1